MTSAGDGPDRKRDHWPVALGAAEPAFHKRDIGRSAPPGPRSSPFPLQYLAVLHVEKRAPIARRARLSCDPALPSEYGTDGGGFGFDMVRLRSVMPQTACEKFRRQAPTSSRMSGARSTHRGSFFLRLLGSPVRAACLGAIAVFLWAVAQFYRADTGFTGLVSIGDRWADLQVTALREMPHFVYEKSAGYDGAYYLQIALYPTLENPELKQAIDNLPYRARRILFSWVAWLLGFGQPAWIAQVFALFNVACWFALAWVLCRWFPLTSWENFFRWFAILFSHGLCMSVRHSLVDGPALLLIALALRWLEDGRRIAGVTTLALAGLGRETSLLAAAGLDFDPRAPRSWWRTAATAALVALPLLVWVAYLRLRFGPPGDTGMGNFTLPLAGFAEKARDAVRIAFGGHASALHWATLGVVVSLGVQWMFFVVRWQPANRWWRTGAAFALLMMFLATPVWEGFPGAATRVLLPMTLAFNVLVPRGRKWLPLVIAGNLSVFASVFEFSPPHDFYRLHGDRELREAVRVVAATGWHGPERHLERRWRWSADRSELRVINESSRSLLVALHGSASAAVEPRTVRVSLGERMIWSGEVGLAPRELRFGFTAPPGETVLVFTSNLPATKVGSDPRELAFMVANVEISVRAAP